MFFFQFARKNRRIRSLLGLSLPLLWLSGVALIGTGAAQAEPQQQQPPANTQQQNPQPQPSQPPPGANTQQKPSEAPPPEAGGPGNDVGPYVIPKKKEEPPPPPAEKPKKVEGMPDYSINVEVPLVNLDVLVTTKNGQFVPGLKKDNFRVLEDGVAQPISNFSQAEAPITAVLLVEFASTNYQFLYDALNASYTFAGGLKKEDWVAVVSYDMRPHILVDFTQDKRAVYGALNQLRIPGFSERNVFDALYDTLDRLDRLEGRKYIILVSTGVDTFSKLNLDQILKKVKSTRNVTIFSVGIGRALVEWAEAHGYLGSLGSLNYLQAENQLNTFSRMTGGRAYFPRFQGELPEIFRDIASDIRNEYNIAYHPTNAKLDGSYRKLKVELVAPDGGPLKIKDQKGHDLKYQIIARDGYTAKHTVE
ncbi:MAG: VWA domain-containing protein [Acidobacteria bacterium]|nr:MAG: VWA domain-containing protein [Acidobacteriota bacterium]